MAFERPHQSSATRIPTHAEISARVADRIQIAALDARILALETSIRILREERGLLQERVVGYTYPVLTLPTEIVSHIFVHFLPGYPICPPISGPLSPKTLGQICHRWREIALSTPELWSAISLFLTSARHLQKPGPLRILEGWLERSCSCPLSIDLGALLPCYGGNIQAQALEPFVDVLFSHSSRWQYVKIKLPLSPARMSTVHAPLLRSLNLSEWSSSRDLDWKSSSMEAPQLRQVTLDLYHTAFLPLFPCAQLTSLCTSSISPRQFVEILQHSVNLVDCKSTILLPSAGADGEEINPRHLTLCYLELLDLRIWSGKGHPPKGWLDKIALPALRKLQIPENLLYPDPVAVLVALVSRSRSLEKLRIPGGDWQAEAYLAALPPDPDPPPLVEFTYLDNFFDR
ncbi:hypothetical protein DFH06DRAFT_521610 [Mycena polygramma]|nr:hypothetical protein DFH06DRAFT_521610 [Mycena polygramma]